MENTKIKNFVDIINVYNSCHIDNIDLPFDEITNTFMDIKKIYKKNIVCDLETLLEVSRGNIRIGHVTFYDDSSYVPLLLVYNENIDKQKIGLFDGDGDEYDYGNKKIRVFLLNHTYKYVIEPVSGYTTITNSKNGKKSKVYYIHKELSSCDIEPNNFSDIPIFGCYIGVKKKFMSFNIRSKLSKILMLK